MATKKKAPVDQARRDAYAQAVLTGIYASTGRAVLEASNHEYTAAQEMACKVAFDQADKCMGDAS